MTLSTKNKFDPQFDLVDDNRKPSQMHRDYMVKLDALVAQMAAGNLPTPLVNAVNDAGAAAGGVAIGALYRNGSQLMVRVV